MSAFFSKTFVRSALVILAGIGSCVICSACSHAQISHEESEARERAEESKASPPAVTTRTKGKTHETEANDWRGESKTTLPAFERVEEFADLQALMTALAADNAGDAEMSAQIKRGDEYAHLPRRGWENKVVRVRCFLQSIRASNDNDYGMSLSLHEDDDHGIVMAAEVTGLPETKGNKERFEMLVNARKQLESNFMGLAIERDESSPRNGLLAKPILVEVEGALFFSPPRTPAPSKDGSPKTVRPFRPTTGWQLHPLKSIRIVPAEEG